MKKALFAAVLVAGLYQRCPAAAPADTTVSAPRDTLPLPVLVVESALPGVRVFVDSLPFGETPLRDSTIPAGRHVVRLVHPDYRNWLHSVLIDTVVAERGDRLRLRAEFPAVLSVNTDPSGAGVRWNDSLIGNSPLRLAAAPASGLLSVTTPGYDTAVVRLPSSREDLDIRLHSEEPLVPGMDDQALASAGTATPMPTYIAAGVAIAGGISAAYFKINADNHYQDYLQTDNTGELDRVRRLDLAAGISLAISQAGLLALTYLLLSR